MCKVKCKMYLCGEFNSWKRLAMCISRFIRMASPATTYIILRQAQSELQASHAESGRCMFDYRSNSKL